MADAEPMAPTGMVGSAEIDRRLGYHPATRETIPLYEANRARFVELACHLDTTLPPSRELSLALTALQESLMWSNAAVACNLAPLEDPAGRQPNPLVQRMSSERASETFTVAVAAPPHMSPQAVADAVREELLHRMDPSAADRPAAELNLGAKRTNGTPNR